MKALELVDRYTKSVFELAGTETEVDLLRSELVLFSEIMTIRPELMDLLQSPLISRSEKRSLLEGIRPDTSSLGERFLTLLVEKRRMDLLPAIVRRLQVMLDEQRGIQETRVITHRPLDPSTVPLIEKALAQAVGKKVACQYETDEQILGGIQIYMGNRLIDGTIRRKLNELRAQFKAIKVHEQGT